MSRKNPFKGAIVLTIVAALTVGLYFVLDPYFESSEQAKEEATLLFSGLDRSEIFEIKIQNGTQTFWIKKRADAKDSWTVSDSPDENYDADSNSINGIISTLLAARKESTVNGLKVQDVQLSPPKFIIEISHGKDAKKEMLSLGKDTPVDYLVYARWNDNPDIFLTSRSLRFGVDKTLKELRNKKIFNFNLAEFKKLHVEAIAKKEFESLDDLDFTKDEKGNWSSKVGNKEIALKSSDLANFVNSIKKLSVQDFVSEDGDPQNEFRLKSPIMRFSFVKEGNPELSETWNLSMINKDQKKTFYLGKKDGKSVYEVAASFKDTFDVGLIKFRETKITDIAQADIKNINIQIPNVFDLRFKKDASQKWSAEWTLAKDKSETLHKGDVKTAKLDEILKSMSQLRAVDFFDTESAKSLGLSSPGYIVELGETDQTKTLFFGRKRNSGPNSGLWPVNAEFLNSPASVKIDLATILPTDIKEYIEKTETEDVVAESNTESDAKNNGKTPAAKKGNKVKLEPTVKDPKEIRKLPAPITKAGHKYTAVLKLSNEMTLEFEFDAAKAPYTVSNFLHLARNNFYNDVVYHRVIPDFVIQGGDPTGTGSGGPGYKFDNEDNDLKHLRGSLSMAHAGRNTNGSQYFIVLAPQPHLDGVHTVFGKVTKGVDQLDNIPQGTKMVTVEVFEEAL